MVHENFVPARSWRTLAATAALLAAGAGAAHAGPTYAVQSVQAFGDTFTNLLGINDAGTSVGFHNAVANQGFVRAPGGALSDFIIPNAAQTQVVGISNNGNKTGFYVDQGGTTHGFVANAGQPPANAITFDRPGTAFNQLLGINNSLVVAGYSSLDPAGMTLQKALTFNVLTQTYTDINAVLPANVNSQATGINDNGAVVGFWQPTATTSDGFLISGGQVLLIDPFGAAFAQALGVNDLGEVVGTYADAGGTQHGFYGDLAHGFTSFDPAGSLSTTINGINDLGQFVGFYTDARDVVNGFVASPVGVPEPAALALLGIGVLSIAALRRTRAAGGRA